MKKEGEHILDRPKWAWIILIVLLAGVTLAWYFLPGLVAADPNAAIRGQIGDSFGSVNALFTGLAFAGLIFTILLQRREIQLQRQEMKAARKQFERQADAQSRATEAAVAGFYVEAWKAEITAIEMDSGVMGPDSRRDFSKQIREVVKAMRGMAEQFEPTDNTPT